MSADWERDLDAEEMAGCLGPLQLVAALVASACVVFADVWWLTRVAWAVVALGMWLGAWRNLTNPWWRIERQQKDADQ